MPWLTATIEKNPHSNEDPALHKINFFFNSEKTTISALRAQGVSFGLEAISGPWEKEQNMTRFTNLRVILAQGPC